MFLFKGYHFDLFTYIPKYSRVESHSEVPLMHSTPRHIVFYLFFYWSVEFCTPIWYDFTISDRSNHFSVRQVRLGALYFGYQKYLLQGWEGGLTFERLGERSRNRIFLTYWSGWMGCIPSKFFETWYYNKTQDEMVENTQGLRKTAGINTKCTAWMKRKRFRSTNVSHYSNIVLSYF